MAFPVNEKGAHAHHRLVDRFAEAVRLLDLYMRNIIVQKGGESVSQHVGRCQIGQPLQYFIHDEILGEAAHEEKTRSCSGKAHLSEYNIKGSVKADYLGQHASGFIQ
ncbi:hypothetical protein D3C81_229410 [compost metagenome]